jgi:hypothetical protein
MRKIYVVLFFIVCLQNTYADKFDDFRLLSHEEQVYTIRLLSPEEQVHAMVETFKYYERLPITFTYCSNILTENPEGVKPVLFRYLKELNPPPPSDRSDMSYKIIDGILWSRFYFEKRLLTREEEELLAELYQEKLDYYLKTYKWVDRVVYGLDNFITILRTGEPMPYTDEHNRSLVKKYTDLGYKDLRYGF